METSPVPAVSPEVSEPPTSLHAAIENPPQDILDDSNPWPGLDFYTEETRQYFHGRGEETEELLSRVRRRRITVLYGQSGLGKSSVVQAGLFPLLRKDAWFPIYIRLRYRAENPGADSVESLLDQTLKEISRVISDAMAKGTLVAAPGSSAAELLPRPNETLREYLQRPPPGLLDGQGRAVALVLAFDQFEELFTLGRTASRLIGRNEFIREMARCVEDEPVALTRTNVPDSEIATGEITGSGRSWRGEYRVLISLREDFLAQLNDLGLHMPTVLENQMHLLHMDGWKALQAVATPGKKIIAPLVAREIVRYVAAQVRDDEASARTLQAALDEAAPDHRQDLPNEEEDYDHIRVDPAILSWACRELNAARMSRGEEKITEALVRELLQPGERSVFRRFYDESFPLLLRKDPQSTGPIEPANGKNGNGSIRRDAAEAIKKYIEDELLEGKRRDFKNCERAKADLLHAGVEEPEAALLKLVNRRLLRICPGRDSSSMVIELTHDVLCDPVARSRDERLRREAEQAAAKAAALKSKSDMIEQEARRKQEIERRIQAERQLAQIKKQRILGVIVAVLAVLLAIVGAVAWWQSAKTREIGELGASEAAKYLERAVKLEKSIGPQPSNGEAVRALWKAAIALRIDEHNAEAAALACRLLATRSWCVPLANRLEYQGNASIFAGGYTPGDRKIAAINSEGQLLLWDGKTFAAEKAITLLEEGRTSKSTRQKLTAASFSGDGQMILFSWQPPENTAAKAAAEVGEVRQPAPVTAPAAVWRWTGAEYVSAGRELALDGMVRSVNCSQDGSRAVLSSRGALQTVVRVFNFNAEGVIDPAGGIIKTNGDVSGADISADGKWIATSSSTGEVRLWDAESLGPAMDSNGLPIVLGNGNSVSSRVTSVSISRDRGQLVTTGFIGPARLWSVADRKVREIRPPGQQGQIFRAAFNPAAGKTAQLAAGANGMVMLWDTSKNDLQLVAEPLCTEEAIVYPTYSEDGKRIITLSGGSWNAMQKVRVWSAEPISALPGAADLKFTGRNAPPWLQPLAEAVAGRQIALDDEDPDPLTLEKVRALQKEPVTGEYAPVWNRFFGSSQ